MNSFSTRPKPSHGRHGTSSSQPSRTLNYSTNASHHTMQGAFSHVEKGCGAAVETRETIESLSADKRVIRARARSHQRILHRKIYTQQALSGNNVKKIIICLVALITVFIGAYFIMKPFIEKPAAPQAEADMPQQQVAPEVAIEYRGMKYYIQEKDDGSHVLSAKAANSSQDDASELAQIKGTPIQLILYNGALLIPENLSDGTWDVLAYTFSPGSVPSAVVDAQGAPIVGTGELVKAELRDPHLVVTDANHKETSISLV